MSIQTIPSSYQNVIPPSPRNDESSVINHPKSPSNEEFDAEEIPDNEVSISIKEDISKYISENAHFSPSENSRSSNPSLENLQDISDRIDLNASPVLVDSSDQQGETNLVNLTSSAEPINIAPEQQETASSAAESRATKPAALATLTHLNANSFAASPRLIKKTELLEEMNVSEPELIPQGPSQAQAVVPPQPLEIVEGKAKPSSAVNEDESKQVKNKCCTIL